jgi:glucokinase
MNDLIVAVDLGGTNIRAALCDIHGRVLKQTARPTLATQGPEEVFSRIILSVRQVTEDWSRIRGIGLGAPGPIDPVQGVVLESPNLPGMVNFPMKARLEAEFQVPAFAGNDANAAALGEHRFGAGRGVRHMVYVTISTGIGGGIIVDNQLLPGWRGYAGEVGHQTLEAEGPRCNCGNVGCLEVLASGTAIARVAREDLAAGRDSRIALLAQGDLARITGSMVTQAASEGDALALELLARAGRYIGLGIVNLLHILDTELFVLGGGVAIHAWPWLYPAILATFDQNAMPSMRKGVRIVQSELGDDVGLVGAAALVMDQTAA